MRFFITTAIPYVNAPPHLGHALEFVQADALVRFLRLQKQEVYFLTGADENSLKNVRAAEKENISVQQLVDRNSQQFYRFKEVLKISFDDFLRTTEKRHQEGAQKLWLACQKDIYKKKYRGLYCVGCEEFYKESELINGVCPEHKTPPELIEEENYFFRLTRYQKELEKIISEDEFQIIPASRKNEVLSFIRSGLEDFCISRSSNRAKGWGIDVPNDPTQKIWVWFDALANYLTALNYHQEGELFERWWLKSDQIIHLVGKGIIRFHAVYWPAMLLSAGIRLPQKLFVHGYLTTNGEKISKSSGTAINPFILVEKYGSDVLRYFLLREFSSFEDGDFSEVRLQQRYQTDLSQGLGNLFSRIAALCEQFGKEIPLKQNDNLLVQETRKNYEKAIVDFRFNEALHYIWQMIAGCDRWLNQTKPWSEINLPQAQAEKEVREILGSLLFAIAQIALLLHSAMPQTAEKILAILQLKDILPEDWLKQKVLLKKQPPLFPKLTINP